MVVLVTVAADGGFQLVGTVWIQNLRLSVLILRRARADLDIAVVEAVRLQLQTVLFAACVGV